MINKVKNFEIPPLFGPFYIRNSNSFIKRHAFFLKGFLNEFINKKNHKKQMKNKQNNRKHPFWDLLFTIPQINPNLYSVPIIIVLKIQKDQSTRTNSHCIETIVSVYRQSDDNRPRT